MRQPTIEFFAPVPQPLFDDIVLLPQDGAKTGGTGRPPNSFALRVDDGLILLDAPFRYVLPAVRTLEQSGHPLRALVLSHRDLLAQGDAFDAFDDVPILLHPDDVVPGFGLEVESPIDHPVLASAGLEVIHFPGHTAGSIMLYTPRHGGVLLAGDSAVAPGPRQDADPPRLERPLGPTRAMTDALADRWRDVIATVESGERPLRSILPLHGMPYVDRDPDDLVEIMRPMDLAPPMNPSGR